VKSARLMPDWGNAYELSLKVCAVSNILLKYGSLDAIVSSSLLQQRIRHLCTAAVAAKEPEELEQILIDLRAALQEQILQMRDMVGNAKEVIAQLPSESLSERRKAKRKEA
jgi:hypothetical protein